MVSTTISHYKVIEKIYNWLYLRFLFAILMALIGSSMAAYGQDGTQKWAFPTGNLVVSSPAIGADGTLYVGSNNFNLYAINPDGTQKWAFLTGGNMGSSPANGWRGDHQVPSGEGPLLGAVLAVSGHC